MTSRGRVGVSSTQFTIASTTGEVVIAPVNTPQWVFNSARLRPVTDGGGELGSGSIRVGQIYSTIGTISTSDAREKTAVRPMTTAEIAAAKDLAGAIGIFQWLSAVELKGEDGARLHPGMTVQRAIEIMESHGLDPMRYGFICMDEWAAVQERTETTRIPIKPAVYESVEVSPAEFDDEGNMVKEPVIEDGALLEPEEFEEIVTVIPGMEAGSRYGFREAQLNSFIARGMEARISALEAALAGAN